MLKNYFMISYRNLIRNKGYSIINISGLSIGMASFLLILLWVQAEVSYDKFHDNSDRIQLLYLDAILGSPMTAPVSVADAGPTMVELYPEVENMVRLEPGGASVSIKIDERMFQEEKVSYADNTIFEVFSFPLIMGNVKDALVAPYTVVISESLARKYFGSEGALGKILEIDGNTEYTITGIMADMPENSSLNFDIIRSFETLISNNTAGVGEWFSFRYMTFLLLAENSDIDALEAKFVDLIDSKMGPMLAALGASVSLYLQPLEDFHLYSNYDIDMGEIGDITHVYLFSGIAILILLIACFNFINLATARSTKRAKEVGLRKTLGADRNKIVSQFLGESIFLCLIAAFFTLILLEISLPLFSSLARYEFNISYVDDWWVIPGLIGLAIVVGLLAGSYPAFFLSSFTPIEALRGVNGQGRSNSYFRSVLVIVQFAISVCLIVGSITIYKQLNYITEKNLGFNKEEVLVIENAVPENGVSLKTIKSEFAQISGITSIAASNQIPGRGLQKSVAIPEGFAPDEAQTVQLLTIDQDFIPTLRIELAAGRNFSSTMAIDTVTSILLNEAAVRKFGWETGIGKTMGRPSHPGDEPAQPLNVVGVVKDFHMASLHNEIEPLMITFAPSEMTELSIRFNTSNIDLTLDQIEKKWKELFPDKQFSYMFLDETFAEFYENDKRLGTLVLSFSSLAIFIGCLGLFGLASFVAEQRTKEIGIRKVLGASVYSIVSMLSREFIYLVLISCIIAWPVAWYGLNRWLNSFAYRIDMDFSMLLLSGLAALVIALVTVSFQATKAAMANPVKALKYE